MKLIQCKIPSDLSQESYDEAVEEIIKNGFNLKSHILIIGLEDKHIGKEIKKTGWCLNICVVPFLPDSAWMILDLKERFIFYSEGI